LIFVWVLAISGWARIDDMLKLHPSQRDYVMFAEVGRV